MGKWWFWITVGLVLALGAVFMIYGGYWVLWTGFGQRPGGVPGADRAKTLWDWMDLLLVPLVLALSATFFTWATNQREQEIEKRRVEERQKLELDRSRETALQTYLDRMTDLIESGLPESTPGNWKQSIARASTLTVLRQLDGERKGLLLPFLYESELVGKTTEDGTERKAPLFDLSFADLHGADLCGAKLLGIQLLYADLSGADLYMADFRWAMLYGAILEGADLTAANLRDATMGSVTKDQFSRSKSLRGAVMPDGTVHE
jgi:hypothetical protein